MNRSKRIFLIFGAVFFLILILLSIDIARKTTFPGSKPIHEENTDSTNTDSLKQDYSIER